MKPISLSQNKLAKRLIMGIAIIGLGASGVYVARQSHVFADDSDSVVVTNDDATNATSSAISTAQIASQAFDRINDALDKGTKLSQDDLDELTYTMYHYAKTPYQFISEDADDSLLPAESGFEKLKTLYEQSGLEVPFTRVTDNNGDITYTFNRTIKKPDSWDKTAKKADKAADKAAETIVNDSSKTVEIDDGKVTVIEGD